MTESEIVKVLKDAGVKRLRGERWAPVPKLPGYLVSTEGRAFRLAATVRQRSRYGTLVPTHHAARLLSLQHRNPRLRVRRPRKADRKYLYVDLGRSVLTTFVRAPRPGERAMRRNEVLWDCRLENLHWSGDVTPLIERFLANESNCWDGRDLEHSAYILRRSNTALTRALTNERRRLGIPYAVSSKIRGPRRVAQLIIEGRAARAAGSPTPTWSASEAA